MATRMQQRRGAAAQWTEANPILAAGEIGWETDTNKFKIGDGLNTWDDLSYFLDETALGGSLEDYVLASTLGQPDGVATLDENGKLEAAQLPDVQEITEDLVDGVLVAGNGITKTYDDNAGTITIAADTSVLATKAELAEVAQDSLDSALVAGTGITKSYNDNANTLTISADTDVIATKTYVTTQIGAIDLSGKQDVVAGVSSTEIGYLDGVTSAIQTQINGKADSVHTHSLSDITDVTATAAEVNLLSGVTATTAELNYVDGVTSAIQTQLDNKAPLSSPSFTGTVSGITASMVGLGNVDNTSDANKPISTATQSALDAKLSLSGGTMTGKITLDSDPTQALHATTKQYVDNVSSGILAKPQVLAATTANLDATYANGTNGVGATLTANANGAFPLIDGVQLTTANGSRGLLVKNQTNAAHNGRYNLTTQGDSENPWVLTRCGLCDEASEIPGAYVFVVDGTVNGQTGWVQHVDDPSTFSVGTDDIDVFQFAGSGSVTAGTGINVVGNQVSVDFDDVAAASHTHLLADITDITASASELNILDGVTASAAELNILDGVTATASELNILSGATLTTTELNYVDGVTSAIQTQLNDKAPLANPSFTGTVVLPSTTSVGDVSSTELGYLNGVTSAIQTQLDSKPTNLDGLTDVVITSAANGQILSYNGTNWVNTITIDGGNA